MQRRISRTSSIVVLLCAGLGLAGCGKFFVKESNTPPPTTTGNYFYVANMTTGTVAGFSVGTSNISGTSNSPYDLGVAPSAIAVTPGSRYVYVSTLAGAIYGYSVGSDGSLSLLNGGNALITGISPVVLEVDPSGKWLVAADQSPAAYVFSIDTTTGLLTPQGNALALDPGSPNRMVFTPDNSLLYVSLGTGGVDIFTFNVSSGVLTKTNQILTPKAVGNGDHGLAVDPGGKFLFVTETGTGGVRVLSIATTGALTEVTGSPFATGVGPAGVMVDSTGSYVYVANRTDGTVSGFTLSLTGTLTAMTGSPFTTGSEPIDLAEDTAGAHIGVACAGGTPDFEVYTIGIATGTTPGALTSFAKSTASTPTGAFGVVAAD